jgi:geranylgeranyl diphosphate synthase type I
MDIIDASTDIRTAPQVLDDCRRMVDTQLRAAIDTLPDTMRRIAGYHLGWWDQHGTPTEHNGGKALRPALVLLSAQAVGGEAADAIPAAVAVELVHNFSLVHDDVIDHDATRRHRATAWSVFGSGAAILAGDALCTLAVDVLAGSGHPAALDAIRMLNGAVQSLIDGQSADMAFEDRGDVEVAECRRMAQAKTGALLGCACALGGRFGGGTPGQVDRMRGFGTHVGLAFQHVDDLLGIWGDPSVTGKPVHSDLRNRKKSLPVVMALRSSTSAATELAALYAQTAPLNASDLSRAATLIDEAGGRSGSREAAELLLEYATEELRATEPPPRVAAELEALARLVTRRDH